MFTKTNICSVEIILEGTLIVSKFENDKQHVDLAPLEKFLRTPRNDRAFSLLVFRYFCAFTHYELLFLSVLLISVSKSTELTRFLLLFHQNYLQ